MRSAGRTVGHLAAVNTLAAILGSLVAGFVLLDWIGLWASLHLLAGIYLALALFLALRRSSLRPLGLVPGLGMILLATLVSYAHYGSVHLEQSRGERMLRAWEGSHGTVVVTEQEGPITERNSKGSHKSAVLAWSELVRYSEAVLREASPADDPYLEEVGDAGRRQVRAGLALSRAETLQREGRLQQAGRAMEEYRRLVASREE